MTDTDERRTPVTIDVPLVERLVAGQFPKWAHLPIRLVALSGWDNRTFHLGNDMSVRLPSAEGYALQVEKEQEWLPRLAPHLPLPVPAPLAMGQPTEEYPWPWSIYRWLPGEPVATAPILDRTQLAVALAVFLNALYRVDATDGAPAGPHNLWRGGPLAVYDGETRAALTTLDGQIDTDTSREIWETALASQWERDPVWVHGDIAVGNLLVEDGRLSAVIDFGSSGVGDPACDLAIAWAFFNGESREAFRAVLQLDEATWARGRAWTLWKALIFLAGLAETNARESLTSRRVIDEVLADHRACKHPGLYSG